MIQTLAADGANDSFRVGILPGRSRRSWDVVDIVCLQKTCVWTLRRISPLQPGQVKKLRRLDQPTPDSLLANLHRCNRPTHFGQIPKLRQLHRPTQFFDSPFPRGGVTARRSKLPFANFRGAHGSASPAEGKIKVAPCLSDSAMGKLACPTRARKDSLTPKPV